MVKDPVYDELTIQGPAWKMSGTPPHIKWICRPIGANNEFIYFKYLGLGKNRLAEMSKEGIL